MTDTQTATAEDTTAAATGTDTVATVNMVKEKFHFKTEKIRNQAGEEIGTGKKHPSVELDLPVPTIARLQTFLADPTKFAKEVELLFATITDQVYRVARGQINDFREKPENKEATVSAASLNYSNLDWTSIANMPKAERVSTIPGEDDIKAFLDSYLAIMPAALNKPVKIIENHIAIYQTAFRKQRSQKEMLEAFQQFLVVYMSTAGETVVDENIEVLDYFNNRLTKLLKSEEKITMDDI